MHSIIHHVLAALLTLNLAFAAPTTHTDLKKTTGCSLSNLRVRKEWSTLSSKEKISYTNAVVCLQNKPSIYNSATYPGIQNRYDDFVGTHINYTLTVHLDGLFLPWHRQYIWLYEEALRNECGYTGASPYWDWPRYDNSLETSPLFDGSATSLSGNGKYDASSALISLGINETLPHGSGGGCVTSGPFVNHKLNLGPFDFSLVFTSGGVLPANAFAANPRCFTRDLNDAIAKNYTNAGVVASLLEAPTIAQFQSILSGIPGTYNLGPHGGGHASLGNSLFDFFASPNDPAFFLHHAQIDRIWAIWQALDPINRVYGNNAISGTQTTLNIPPSPNATFDSLTHYGQLDGDHAIRELMSVVEGNFCYIYI